MMPYSWQFFTVNAEAMHTMLKSMSITDLVFLGFCAFHLGKFVFFLLIDATLCKVTGTLL